MPGATIARAEAQDADVWGAKELHGKPPNFISLLKFKVSSVRRPPACARLCSLLVLHTKIARNNTSHTQALTVGSKVWGAVAEITAKELIISLPHGLRGHVAPAEASAAHVLPVSLSY